MIRKWLLNDRYWLTRRNKWKYNWSGTGNRNKKQINARTNSYFPLFNAWGHERFLYLIEVTSGSYFSIVTSIKTGNLMSRWRCVTVVPFLFILLETWPRTTVTWSSPSLWQAWAQLVLFLIHLLMLVKETQDSFNWWFSDGHGFYTSCS